MTLIPPPQNSTILQSACAPKTYTAAHWSMTRPAVFFLGTKTGNVEVSDDVWSDVESDDVLGDFVPY